MTVTRLEVQYRPPKTIKIRDGNARTHSKKQIEQIARSIAKFGFNNPVLLDRDERLIAGHGRLAAAISLGMTEIPTVLLEHMSPEDIRLYVIADNRLAEKAGWDRELLGLELKYLSELEIEIDLSLTGFDPPEIDILICDLASATDDIDASTITPPEASDVVTRPGDIWTIGAHRLICGDATQAQTYAQLLEGDKAQLVFSDPPYNVPITGHVGGNGAIQHREFAMASGEMTRDQFTAFLKSNFRLLVENAVDGAIHFHCMDWRHVSEIMAASEGVYSEFKNLCVWTKNNGGMGSLYRSQHELVFVFKSGTASHTNNVELGRHGRNRTNVWAYPGVNSWGAGRADLAHHPTVKPVELVADAILDCSTRGGIVLDPFAGSGTTLLACQKTGRKGAGIEIDPGYCDVIVERMRKAFGASVTLAATGEHFDAVKMHRASTTLVAA